MLPIDLLDGWSVSTGNADITKGFHQLAFASEYAMLAVWRMTKASTPSAILPTQHNGKGESAKVYDISGRCIPFAHLNTYGSRQNVYITNSKKYIK